MQASHLAAMYTAPQLEERTLDTNAAPSVPAPEGSLATARPVQVSPPDSEEVSAHHLQPSCYWAFSPVASTNKSWMEKRTCSNLTGASMTGF